jgi:hypothetical protein
MEDSRSFKDLQEIKNLMERSSRFLSLSGLSGVSAGIVAILGAFTIYGLLNFGQLLYDEQLHILGSSVRRNVTGLLLLVASLTFIFALVSALYFSHRKAKKNNIKFWDHTIKRLLVHLFIPLIAGGFFTLILIFRSDITLVASAMLTFYGLALVNAGKYTFGEIHYLGILEIILGLLAGIFTNFGLIFWTIGFGILHIVYGFIMYIRYER